MKALDHEMESKLSNVMLVVDSRVIRTFVSEEVWKGIRLHRGESDPKLTKNKWKFIQFGTNGRLEYISRSMVFLEAEAGAKVKTMVYLIRGFSECLFGKSAAVKLGIVEFHPKGAETVRNLSENSMKVDRQFLEAKPKQRLMRRLNQ